MAHMQGEAVLQHGQGVGHAVPHDALLLLPRKRVHKAVHHHHLVPVEGPGHFPRWTRGLDALKSN